jgi:pimeloyl-ACP methyl ester carboxylesterase
MRKSLSGLSLSLIVTAMVASLAQSADAQSDQVTFTVGPFNTDQPPQVSTSAIPYAGYYAPYAIQAALAYAGDHQLSSTTFDDGPISNKAINLFRAWHLQFSSDGYLGCVDLLDKDCNTARQTRSIPATGLSFQVWARLRPPYSETASCSEVSIAFRGTVNSSFGAFFSSWASNLHIIDRKAGVDDEYDQLGRNIQSIIKTIQTLDCYKRARRPQIVSVGHSLGGGLAEFFALRNPIGSHPRIVKVFTFNTSPIAATDLIDKTTLDANAKRLVIDRINQQGELLSILPLIRRVQQVPARNCKPLTRIVQFNAFSPNHYSVTKLVVPQKVLQYVDSLAYHEINPLAKQLVAWTDVNQESYPALPVSDASCGTDYQQLGPTDDQERGLVSSINGRHQASNRNKNQEWESFWLGAVNGSAVAASHAAIKVGSLRALRTAFRPRSDTTY